MATQLNQLRHTVVETVYLAFKNKKEKNVLIEYNKNDFYPYLSYKVHDKEISVARVFMKKR